MSTVMGAVGSSGTFKENIYHEKQVKELCALHSLNNLFQDPSAFLKCDLDSICERLSPDHWVNPHKSMLGTGNYDINVIMAALETKGCAVKWFDKRKDPGTVAVDLVLGFILNIPSEYRVGPVQLPLRRKHWVSVRRVRGAYYNLDSKLDAPVCIGQELELVSWLREELCCKDKELFIVVSQEVEKTRSWSLEQGDSRPLTSPRSHCNGSTDRSLVVSLPPDDCTRLAGGRALLEAATDEEGVLELGLQQRLLATVEGEEAFTAPGLKYIDYDARSIENSLEGDVTTDKSHAGAVRNGLTPEKYNLSCEVRGAR